MERLVTTAQAASILGISLQGIHYRIKSNKLKSIKQSGKTFVYISSELENKQRDDLKIEETKNDSYIDMIISGKDEQISFLKKSFKHLRLHHKEELRRLEKNQKNIINVFNSEIKLLQSAFSEMRSIYKPQIEQKKDRFISLANFSLYLKENGKSNQDIKSIIVEAIKKNDKRFIFSASSKKVMILNSDFSDLV